MIWKRRKSKTVEEEVVGEKEERDVRICRRNNKLEELELNI